MKEELNSNNSYPEGEVINPSGKTVPQINKALEENYHNKQRAIQDANASSNDLMENSVLANKIIRDANLQGEERKQAETMLNSAKAELNLPDTQKMLSQIEGFTSGTYQLLVKAINTSHFNVNVLKLLFQKFPDRFANQGEIRALAEANSREVAIGHKILSNIVVYKNNMDNLNKELYNRGEGILVTYADTTTEPQGASDDVD